MAGTPSRHRLRFEDIVDKFALRLTEEEKERLVSLYDLPPIYYSKSRVLVFRALRMLGVHSYEKPEGLINIAEVLERRDLIADFKDEVHAIRVRKTTLRRQESSIVNLDEIYSNINLTPTLDLSVDHIDILKANVDLLKKITNHRFRNDDQRRRRIKHHLENALLRLTDVIDSLALARDEVESNAHHAAQSDKRRPEASYMPTTCSEASHRPAQPHHPSKPVLSLKPRRPTGDEDCDYQNIGAMPRRGSLPATALETIKLVAELQRRDSVPLAVRPTVTLPSPPQIKITHSDQRYKTGGSESPRQQSKRPMPLPKPTSRHVRTASQDQVKSLHVTIDSYENTGDSGNGTGDSGIYADHTWPIPQTQKSSEEHHYQALIKTPATSQNSATTENEYETVS